MPIEQEIDELLNEPESKPEWLKTAERLAAEITAMRSKICSYEDNWTIVVGVDPDLFDHVCLAREQLYDGLYRGEYYCARDIKGLGDLTIFNPIFLRDTTVAESYGFDFTYLCEAGKNYEITIPNSYSPLSFFHRK